VLVSSTSSEFDGFARKIQWFIDTFGAEFAHLESSIDSGRVALAIVSGRNQTWAEECEGVRRLRLFQQKLFDSGLAWVSGPRILGGFGHSIDADQFVKTEIGKHPFPDATLVRTGTQVLGPSLLRFGSDLVKDYHLRRIHRGDELVCQLFSEPDAGSDLANIRTSARRTDKGWELSGQKVWSSGALHADYGLCIARTDPDSKRHIGLTAFLIDMKSCGVEVRKIRQMTGGEEFCEIFLESVRVSDDYLIGDVGSGWAIVLDILLNERSTIGSGLMPPRALIDRLIQNDTNELYSGLLIERLAGLFCRYRVTELLIQRLEANFRSNKGPSNEHALAKLAVTNIAREMSDVASLRFGANIMADSGAQNGYAWSEFILGVPGLRIGGGTDEVVKNQIAERVLGLPRK